MLGLSYGEIFLIIGATAALIGPKDLPKIARTTGRLAGRAIGYVQLARGQFDNVMQHTQFRQVNKELQDTMAQLEAIRYEIRSFSIMNPGPLTRTLKDGPNQANADAGINIKDGPSHPSEESIGVGKSKDQPQQNQQNLSGFKAETSVFKESGLKASGLSDFYTQATACARLAESLKAGASQDSVNSGAIDDKPGLLSVLPVSAESAGLLPNRQGEVMGSDIVLEAVLESEVARNAEEFFSQPQNQIKFE